MSSWTSVMVLTGVTGYFLKRLLWPHLHRLRLQRNYKTADYQTNHRLALKPNTIEPYHSMPRVSGPEAEVVRKLFDLPLYMHQYISYRHQTHGPVFRDTVGEKTELVFVSDAAAESSLHKASGRYPDHVVPEAWRLYCRIKDRKRGIFFMDGEEWFNTRGALNRRLFRSCNIMPHVEELSSITCSLMAAMWQLQQQHGHLMGARLIHPLYKWALESISIIAMGCKIETFKCHSDPDCRMDIFIDAIHNIFKQTSVMGQNDPVDEMNKQTAAWCSFVASCDTALHIGAKYAEEAIAASKVLHEQGEPSKCLLDHLLHEEGFSESHVIRIIADLFMAASDTTVSAVQWLLFTIGKNPAAASAARTQINESHLYEEGGQLVLDYADARKLSQCRFIMKETIRLYPVATFITRKLDEERVIGGYLVPKDTMAILSVYSIGRDPKYFKDPLEFKPQRWATDSVEGCALGGSMSVGKLGGMPFGIGNRNCVGKSVAEIMLTLFIAHLLKNFEVKTNNMNLHVIMEMISVPSEELDIELTRLNEDLV